MAHLGFSCDKCKEKLTEAQLIDNKPKFKMKLLTNVCEHTFDLCSNCYNGLKRELNA